MLTVGFLVACTISFRSNRTFVSSFEVASGRRQSIDCAKPRSKYQFCPDSTTFLDSSGVGVTMTSVSRRLFDMMALGS